MIAREAWYRETTHLEREQPWCSRLAVRPIQVDPQEVAAATDMLVEEFEDHLTTYYGRSERPIPPNKYLWAPNWGPKIKVQNVKGEKKHIPITIMPLPVDGTLSVQGWVSLSQPKVLAILLPIGGAPASAVRKMWAEQGDWLKKKMYSTILHELTHTKDLIPQVTYDSPFGDAPPDPAQYFNDPAEVRAFMQQVAWEALQAVEELPDEIRDAPNPSDRLMGVLSQSPTWQRVEKHLRPENRRKIIQGVDRYLRDRGYEA